MAHRNSEWWGRADQVIGCCQEAGGKEPESTLRQTAGWAQGVCKGQCFPTSHPFQQELPPDRDGWGEEGDRVGLDGLGGGGLWALTSSRGPAGTSLASGSCLPLASRMVMMELGMCAC